MDVAQIVSSQPLPKGPALAVYSNSAAFGKVVADNAAPQGLVVDRIVTDVDLDAGMSASRDGLRRSLRKNLADDSVHAVVAAMVPSRSLTMEAIAGVLAECAAEAGKPVVAAFTGILDTSVQLDGLLAPNGESGSSLPCYSSAGSAVAALAAVVRYAKWLDRDQGMFIEPPGCDREGTREHIERLLSAVAGEQLVRLDGGESAALLSRYGIPVVPSAVFESDDEAVDAAERLGWPVVLKTTDPALRHRLDLGGVRLDIEDADSLRRNIAQMRRALEPYGSSAIEVQAMVPVGQACTFRAIEDPLLGPVVSFGLAGDA
ncbi:uncharacterized protein YfiQ [Arthrobacter sp. Hiyo1]|nr:uncharacterized protein YfiQ [Arthrobacter sp. Hiyo1]